MMREVKPDRESLRELETELERLRPMVIDHPKDKYLGAITAQVPLARVLQDLRHGQGVPSQRAYEDNVCALAAGKKLLVVGPHDIDELVALGRMGFNVTGVIGEPIRRENRRYLRTLWGEGGKVLRGYVEEAKLPSGLDYAMMQNLLTRGAERTVKRPGLSRLFRGRRPVSSYYDRAHDIVSVLHPNLKPGGGLVSVDNISVDGSVGASMDYLDPRRLGSCWRVVEAHRYKPGHTFEEGTHSILFMRKKHPKRRGRR